MTEREKKKGETVSMEMNIEELRAAFGRFASMSLATRKFFCQIRFVVENVGGDGEFPEIVLVRWKRTECRLPVAGFPFGDLIFVPKDLESLRFSAISAGKSFHSDLPILDIQNEPRRIHFEAKSQNGEKIQIQMVIQKILFSQIPQAEDSSVQTATTVQASKESQRSDFSANSVPTTSEFGTQTDLGESISPRQRQIIVRTIFILIHRLQSRLLEYQMNERTERNKNTKTKSTNTQMTVPPKAAIPTKSPKPPPIAQMRERLRKIAETHWNSKNRPNPQIKAPSFSQRRLKKIEEVAAEHSAHSSARSSASHFSRSSNSDGTSESTENSTNRSSALTPPDSAAASSYHSARGSQSPSRHSPHSSSKKSQSSKRSQPEDAAESIAESIAEEIMSNRLSELHSSAVGSLDSVRTASDSSLARD